MSHMIYEDYLKSALKHLKTCEYMIENLQNIDDNDMLDNQAKEEWKNHLLRNIYYLCGYVIEGVVNYCIYKTIPTYQRNRNFDVKDLNEFTGWNILDSYSRRRRYGICFRLPESNARIPGIFYKYFIGNHQYCDNMEFLKLKFPTPFNRIRIISSARNSTNKLSVMFYDWKVDMRYQTDNTHFNSNPTLNYTQGEIEAFFIFVRDEIYAKLPLLR